MRISALAAQTDVAVGTIKFYLREGLLPPGHQTSRTTAEYDESHVERIRLVRALTDAGGLGIATVRRVLTVIDAPDPERLEVLATAQDALLAADTSGDEDGAERECPDPAGGAQPASDDEGPSDAAPPVGRAHTWVAARGWPTQPGDQAVARLEQSWEACEEAGIHVDDAMMDAYADAVEHVARVDVAAVPPGADDAVRRVVVGTVMLEPVLSALRLLAQRQVSLQMRATR